MIIKYKIDSPNGFSEEEKDAFLVLLKKQGQVEDPNLEKINTSSFICLTYADKTAIGIGALKNVYKKPFEYANVTALKDDYELELGYLFVDSNQNGENYRGLGIGKNITRMLLTKVADENLFATTELNQSNTMLHILKGFGFESIGNPYKGIKTGKIISLMILNRKKSVAIRVDDLASN